MIRLNKIICLDLELSCWDGDKQSPEGEFQEIIELGVAVYDRTNGIVTEKRSFPVRPERSRISPFCTELTGWTWEALRHAPPLQGALSQLVEAYGPKNKLWVSWGEGDRTCLERVCAEQSLKYPFSGRHLNLKTMFALLLGLKGEVGLAKALEMAKIEPEGRAHNGADDAWNTAKLLHWLLEGHRIFMDEGN